MSETTWVVWYVIGTREPRYKNKLVKAATANDAIRKARVKNIVDLYPREEA